MNHKLPPLNSDNSLPPERVRILVERITNREIDYSDLNYHDRCNKEIALKSLENEALGGSSNNLFPNDLFPCIPKCFYNDKDIIAAAYRIDANHLGDASLRLREDKGYILDTIEKYPLQTFKRWTASPELAKDDDFLLEVLKLSPNSFEDMPSHLKNNLDIALSVVSRNGKMLKFCSMSFRDNLAMVKAAITNYPEAILDASESCMRDESIVLPLLAQNGLLIDDLPERVITKKMCLVAVENNCLAYSKIKDEYKKDVDIATVAMNNELDIENLHSGLNSNIHLIKMLLNEEILRLPSYLERYVEPENMASTIEALNKSLQSGKQSWLLSVVRHADCSDEDADVKSIVQYPPKKDNIDFVDMALSYLDDEHLAKLFEGTSPLKNTLLRTVATEEFHRRKVFGIEKKSASKDVRKRKVMP